MEDFGAVHDFPGGTEEGRLVVVTEYEAGTKKIDRQGEKKRGGLQSSLTEFKTRTKKLSARGKRGGGVQSSLAKYKTNMEERPVEKARGN